jgi:hypothetical protein
MGIRHAGLASFALACTGALVLLASGGGAWAATARTASSRCRTYAVSGKKIHVCNGLNGKAGGSGPAGPQGPQGAQGPAGPQGPAGVAIPLIFEAQYPTPNTRIFEWGGLLINASCSPSTLLFGVSEIEGSVVRATDVTGGGSATIINDTRLNEVLELTPGGAESNYELTYLGGNGSSIVTADYGTAYGGLRLVNVSCAVFGTAQIATG